MSTNWYSEYDWIEKHAPRARKNDNYKCKLCGKTNEKHKKQNGCRLHVHHIIKRRYFEKAMDKEDCDLTKEDLKQMANSQDNLVTLCASCHKQKIEVLTVNEQSRLLGIQNPILKFDLPPSINEDIN